MSEQRYGVAVKPRVYRSYFLNGQAKWTVAFGLQCCVEYFDQWEMAMLRTKFPGVRV